MFHASCLTLNNKTVLYNIVECFPLMFHASWLEVIFLIWSYLEGCGGS